MTKNVTQTYTVNVPYEETRQATRTVCKPVTKNVTQTYTVNVPYEETRQATARLQASDQERDGDLHGQRYLRRDPAGHA